jgi:hypothetical protein
MSQRGVREYYLAQLQSYLNDRLLNTWMEVHDQIEDKNISKIPRNHLSRFRSKRKDSL